MKQKKNLHHNEAHLLNDTTPFAIREAFNRLRTNLMYTVNDKEGCPIFAVTSDDQSAGKSTVIANTATSFAMSGKRVLLIDADMRAPMQYRLFRQNRTQTGLSDLLSGIEADESRAIVEYGNGLFLLVAGKNPPNPSELIMSHRFEVLLKKWSSEYDAIFIDFPPVGIVADTLAIKDLVTGYIFVIRSGVSDANRAKSALEAMEQVNAKVLGVVLNDVQAKSKSYAKKKYHYRSHYESSYDAMHSKKSKKGD